MCYNRDKKAYFFVPIVIWAYHMSIVRMSNIDEIKKASSDWKWVVKFIYSDYKYSNFKNKKENEGERIMYYEISNNYRRL